LERICLSARARVAEKSGSFVNLSDLPPPNCVCLPSPQPPSRRRPRDARELYLGEIPLKNRIQSCSIRCYLGLLRHAGAALLGLLFTLVCCGNAAAQQTIWPSTIVPAAIDNGASGPLELGVSFKSDVSGTITGVRFYKSSANTGTHVGRLWGPKGALLHR